MNPKLKRFLWVWGPYVGTYLLLRWATGNVWISLGGALLAHVLAVWDWSLRASRDEGQKGDEE